MAFRIIRLIVALWPLFQRIAGRWPGSTAGVAAAGIGVGLVGGLSEAFPSQLAQLLAVLSAQGLTIGVDAATGGMAGLVAVILFPLLSWLFKKFPAISEAVEQAEKQIEAVIPQAYPVGQPDIKPDNQTMRGDVQKPTNPLVGGADAKKVGGPP